jgi:chondroitin synthase
MTYKISYTPFKCKEINDLGDLDYYSCPPANFPKKVLLPPIEGLANDYTHLEKNIFENPLEANVKVSIVVTTFNRADALSKTLAGIVNQSYPSSLIEVVVTDDGSSVDTIKVIREFSAYLNIKYVWHKDIGYTLATARNNGIKIASNDFIILLDDDMYPSRNLILCYVKYANILNKSMLMGPRKYIDISDLAHAEIIKNIEIENTFKEILTNNVVAGKFQDNKSVDWRLEVFNNTDNLKKEKIPFRVVAGGNMAFSKQMFNKIGKFEERFNSWGHEDGELGFRFFNEGMYIIPVLDALAFHQEPLGGKNETDREAGKKASDELYGRLCPYYRHLTTAHENFETPTVSIYIPAYNAQNTICDAIDSALNQTFKDLEVCVCDDGSTDETSNLLNKYFSNNPRVRLIRQTNGGIGKASNTAVSMSKGIYIGQLDSDDYLATDVVEKCVAEMTTDMDIGLVYTSFEQEYPDGSLKPGGNFPIYNREWMYESMIVHHFRFFRRLYWARTSGFDETVINAVDYDMHLKLSEVCHAKHLNVRGYRRRLHGANTSIVNFAQQINNTGIVVNKALNRLGINFSVRMLSDTNFSREFIEL